MEILSPQSVGDGLEEVVSNHSRSYPTNVASARPGDTFTKVDASQSWREAYRAIAAFLLWAFYKRGCCKSSYHEWF